METYIGSICAFGFNYQTPDWLYCNGATVQTMQYQALFALIAGVYGPVGGGSSSFVLPDLRGRTLVGEGNSPYDQVTYTLGAKGGSEAVALTATTYPGHAHNVSITIGENNAANGTTSPVGAYPGLGPASGRSNTPIYAASATAVNMAALPAIALPSTGTGTYPVLDIRRPYVAVNYMISTNGIFPPRN